MFRTVSVVQENSCGCDQRGQLSMPPQSQTPQNMSSTEFDIYDDLDNVFTNALFENLDAPFLFPYSKDNGKLWLSIFKTLICVIRHIF